MHTKLTLRIDEDLIKRAKTYSRQTGKSVSQLVADYLEMSVETVRTHIRAIYKKLHVHSAAEAVARALREKLT